MARTEYNKVQYAHQRKVNEAVKRFAELNPEHFRELQERAKYELEHPKPREVIKHTYSLQNAAPIDLDTLLFPAGERQYFLLGTDNHLFYESGPAGATVEELSETVKRHEWFTGRIIEVAQCSCPACKRRDEAEGKPYDYTKTDTLLAKYFAERR